MYAAQSPEDTIVCYLITTTAHTGELSPVPEDTIVCYLITTSESSLTPQHLLPRHFEPVTSASPRATLKVNHKAQVSMPSPLIFEEITEERCASHERLKSGPLLLRADSSRKVLHKFQMGKRELSASPVTPQVELSKLFENYSPPVFSEKESNYLFAPGKDDKAAFEKEQKEKEALKKSRWRVKCCCFKG